MDLNEVLEERIEAFEGNIRKLEELVGQLELWSDVNTINHKKEATRLVEYVELHLNLELLKEELKQEILALKEEDVYAEQLSENEKRILTKLQDYVPTEETIHEWIRAIKDCHPIIAKEPVLEENRAFILSLLDV